MSDQRRVEEREVRGVGEYALMQALIVPELPGRLDPHLLRWRTFLWRKIARQIDGTDLDRTLALPVSLEGIGQAIDEPLFELGFARQGFRRRHFRHLDLMLEPSLLFVEGGRHREDRLSVLNGDHTAGCEASAIANAVHVVDDRYGGIAGAKEVSVQR